MTLSTKLHQVACCFTAGDHGSLSFVRRLDPKRVISNIGRRIAELRVARGWTQEAFAEVLGMATQNVARIEQGRADFRVTTLVRLATALGCDPQVLWEPPTTRKPRPGRPKATTSGKTVTSARP
jgi:ribosome-binding protein aMBF1 (putative translation factor)